MIREKSSETKGEKERDLAEEVNSTVGVLNYRKK